jgi:chaperonin GroES
MILKEACRDGNQLATPGRPRGGRARRTGGNLRGELVLPETAKERPQQGEVLAAGAGRMDDQGKRLPMDVKVGDKVLFAKYAGTEVKLGDKKLLILKESDILAIVE